MAIWIGLSFQEKGKEGTRFQSNIGKLGLIHKLIKQVTEHNNLAKN